MDRPLTHVHIEGSLPQLCPDVSVEAGFLAEFAGRGCAMRLALFQRATRCRPVRRRSSRTLIAVANEKDRAIRIEKHESRHFSEGATSHGRTLPNGPRLSCGALRSEEHTSELQSHSDLVCRLLLE